MIYNNNKRRNHHRERSREIDRERENPQYYKKKKKSYIQINLCVFVATIRRVPRSVLQLYNRISEGGKETDRVE